MQVVVTGNTLSRKPIHETEGHGFESCRAPPPTGMYFRYGGSVYTVEPTSELAVSEGIVRFEGGDTPICVFVTEFARGNGTTLHRHPYDEVFLVESGVARFVVGEESIEVGAGNFVTVAAGTPHGYGPVGDSPLRVIGIHPAGTAVQENLRETFDS